MENDQPSSRQSLPRNQKDIQGVLGPPSRARGWPERTPQKLGPVNRFFSGALLPLIVLIYLASQTLLGTSEPAPRRDVPPPGDFGRAGKT